MAQVRIDKWLWAARFFKTRSAATEAVLGGRVHVDGERVKPSRDVRAGDTLEVTIGHVRRTVVVRAVAERRGPASVAATLYEEKPESVAERERLASERRLPERTGESEQSLKRRREHQKEMVLGAMGISIPLFAIAAIFTGLAGVLAVCAVLAVIAVASTRSR